MSDLLIKWINTLVKHDKESYIKMMKEDGIYDLIHPVNEFNGSVDGNKSDEVAVRSTRKRRFSKVAANLNFGHKELSLNDLVE